MLSLATRALIILFALNKVSAASPPDPTLTFKMERLKKSSHYTSSVQINDKPPVQMMIDTGACPTTIARWYADEIRIPPKKGLAVGEDTKGHSIEFYEAKLASLRLGTFQKLEPQAVVVPMPDELALDRIAGFACPQTVLEGQMFVLDFPRQRILLGEPPATPLLAEVPLELCPGKSSAKLSVSAKLNGVPGKFYLDTGAARTSITSSFSDKLVHSKVKPQGLKRATLEIGKLREMLAIQVESDKIARSCPGIDGRLGSDFLTRYALQFSGPRDQLRIFK